MEKKQEFIINVLYIAIICALVYFGINYLFGIIVPFVLGFIFAYLTVRICRRLLSSDSKLYRGITLALLYIVLILLIALIISSGLDRIESFIRTLPNFYKDTIDPYINSLESTLMKINDDLPESISASLNEITDGFFEAIKNILSKTATGLVNITTTIVKKAPETMVSIIVMIVTSFYFVFDYEYIATWFTGMLSEKMLNVFYEIKDFIENTLFKIFGSYIVIMGVTFIELFIGLSLIRISNSGMWAFAIAILDILPVLGVGTVLLPWGISSLLTGNVALGIELLILYLIITVIRNIIEPRLVGTDLGLHPLATLFTMIVGLRVLGPVGMFGMPLTLSFFMHKKNAVVRLTRKTKKISAKNKKKDNKE